MRSVEKIRILLVTRESLRKDRNEGNILLNLFEGLPVELAHIGCKPEPPDNDVCQGRYFQITDKMVIEKLLRRIPMGSSVQPELKERQEKTSNTGRKLYDFFRNYNWNIFYILQDILWALAGTQSPALDAFIDGFKPDMIFAPLTPYWYANRLQNRVIRYAGVPAVTYFYDDIYSLKQFNLSPFYWIHRFAVRDSIQKNLPLYSFAYTMTEQQKKEYEKLLHIPMRVLRKPAPHTQCEKVLHDDIRMIYAGNIYYGRDKTLAMVADAVRALRAEGNDLRLDIYTSSPMKKKMRRWLDDGIASFVHPAISAEELGAQYAQSDIALHVESFRKKDALVTRLSFSTKIVDCLASGCAVLAVCPEINAGWQYLRDERAALCVSDKGRIEVAVQQLVTDYLLRKSLCETSMQCLEKKHNRIIVRKRLFDELASIVRQKG